MYRKSRDAHSAGRRRFLAAGAALTAAVLPACSRAPRWDGTFFQPWAADARRSRSDWHQRLSATRALGFDRILLQWMGRQYGDENWLFSDVAMAAFLDAARELDMVVCVGLPYDERWDAILGSDSLSQLTSFFDNSLRDCNHVVGNAPWRHHPALESWYIPYEIEQYSWSTAERASLLSGWLRRLANCMADHSGRTPRISTYASLMATEQTLEALWQSILGATQRLRPMVQDGVGVAGLENFDRLRPLMTLFSAEGIKYDLILELFTQTAGDGHRHGGFDAVAADYGRIEQQLQLSREAGADQIFAFAADPWITRADAAAKTLRKHWRARPARKH